MKGKVVQIPSKMAIDFVMPRHYSGRKPNVTVAFGWYVDGELQAVVTFGKPSSPFLCKGICGEEYASQVYELNRLVRNDNFHEPLSSFVGAVLRRLRVNRWIIVSFSDMAMNHHGYIYQACNFIYTGCTKERTDIYAGKGRHSRHYTKDDALSGIRVVRSPKHRYVFFATYLKQEKQRWIKALKYPVLPYPKGDNNADYALGDYLKPTIVVTNNNC